VLVILLFLFLQSLSSSPRSTPSPNQQARAEHAPARKEYVGSKACSPCHQAIYDSFVKTDMGRSMSTVTPALLAAMPPSPPVFNARLNRYFSVSVRQGQLYQSEWEADADGKDVFRETQRIDWLIGAGANAVGGIIRRGDQLFEAPLTFYEKTQTWALSPGYLDADRGFNRPIEEACVACHSARPNPVSGAVGQFHIPAFDELAIGCESCHGPGAGHVREKQERTPHISASPAMVNPAKLSAALADNICMYCHQNGDARVLQPEKRLEDFRPGQPLDRTLAILMVPPTRESPPDSDHVQHYFSMTLSKCYRSPSGKLSCITCHDPHVQPTREDAPAYFRTKCLECHAEASCTAPQADRQRTNPADNCIGCHMPQRNIIGISHASLTNHRILKTSDEPFPDVTFQLATRSLPDLVHLDAVPGQSDSVPSPLTLLQAYGQLGVQNPQYTQRYYDTAKQLEATEPDNPTVLEALAASALQLGTPEAEQAAMKYLSRALTQGSTAPWDYEQLGSHLLRAHEFSAAEVCLRKGIHVAPYDAQLYILLAEGYATANRQKEAVLTLTEAIQLFPQIDLLRQFRRAIEDQTPATTH
jgi:hypothetical protein